MRRRFVLRRPSGSVIKITETTSKTTFCHVQWLHLLYHMLWMLRPAPRRTLKLCEAVRSRRWITEVEKIVRIRRLVVGRRRCEMRCKRRINKAFHTLLKFWESSTINCLTIISVWVCEGNLNLTMYPRKIAEISSFFRRCPLPNSSELNTKKTTKNNKTRNFPINNYHYAPIKKNSFYSYQCNMWWDSSPHVIGPRNRLLRRRIHPHPQLISASLTTCCTAVTTTLVQCDGMEAEGRPKP